MSHDTLDAARSDADAHREGLASALSALLSSRAPDTAGHAAAGQLADTARDLALRGLHAARANPAGIAFVGAGLAMLATPTPKRRTRPDPGAALTGEADRRIEAADARHQQQARVRANRLDASPGAAHALRVKLDAGLDKLDPDARAKVRAARLQAISAQEHVERHAKRLAEQAQQLHAKRPLATVLAAAGIGALIGAALPGTRREADLLGAKRDQLLRDAEAMLRAEVASLEARGKDAVDAGMTAARGTLQDVSDGTVAHG